MRKIIPQIILASQSKPRKLLLENLRIQFDIVPANINESELPNESPTNLVERLSKSKGQAVLKKLLTTRNPNTINNILIISSDQVAIFNNKIYGKPGNYNSAYKQLKLFNNNTIEFITGLSIIYLANNKIRKLYTYETSQIKLKNLSNQQIKNYLHKEQPYSSAASFKIEGLGISLVESIKTNDYSSIIGLPLIKLTKIFNKLNLDILEI